MSRPRVSLLSLLLGFIVLLFSWFVFFLFRFPDEPLVENLPGSYRLRDRYGELITDIPKRNGYFRPYTGSLAPRFVELLLTVEDRRFRQHLGVDLFAKIRALFDNIRAGKIVSGASTITEQYIKNHYFRAAPRTLLQKLRESALALRVSVSQWKDQVLRSYLDSVYLGRNCYGIACGLSAFFHVDDLAQLSDADMIRLIALFRYPNTKRTDEALYGRWSRWIASHTSVTLTGGTIQFRPYLPFNLFPHVTRLALETCDHQSWCFQLQSVDESLTIDARLQRLAIQQSQDILSSLSGKNVTNAAVYAFRPHTGDILVYQWSKSYSATDIDGATDVIRSKRQIGSAIKPFLYLLAFSRGASPDSLLLDAEKDFVANQSWSVFHPLNYNLRSRGVVRLADALGNSLNTATVRLVEFLGLESAYRFLTTAGITLDHPVSYYGFGLSVGVMDVRFSDMVRAYALLLDNPVYEPSLFLSHELIPLKPLAVSTVDRYLLEQTLLAPLNRRSAFGLSSVLDTSVPQAVKTGTSTDFRDNWTFSYSDDLVMGVWVGNNDNSSMEWVTGVDGAGALWHAMLESAISSGYVHTRKKTPPEGLKHDFLCLDCSCFEKMATISREGKVIDSRIRNSLFFTRDFFVPPNELEKRQFGIVDVFASGTAQ